eukprot:1472980-Rhodomonas_salina.2
MLRVHPHRAQHHPDPSLLTDLHHVVEIACEIANSATPGLLHPSMLRVIPHRPEHHRDPSLAGDLDLVVGMHSKVANSATPSLLHPGT